MAWGRAQAQSPQAASAGEPPPDTVIRINVNLVQMDAVVTDRHGNPVTTLKAGDFRILQDGKEQEIRDFAYISNRGIAAAPGAAADLPSATHWSTSAAHRTTGVTAGQVHRTIALLVDDLGLSFDSVARVRSSLRKFVDQQMQDGDLVAVVRTGAGMGALEQFTSDKRLLYAAIDHVRYNALGRVGVSSFTPVMLDPDIGPGSSSGHGYDYYSGGSVGAVAYVLDGLRELPGRKSLVLFSENMSLFSRSLADRANRSSVAIYCIDPRGVETAGVTASDDTAYLTPQQIDALPGQRAAQEFISRAGMAMLAQSTGGLFLHSGIDDGLRRVLGDSRYYLIGYYPQAGTFDAANPPRFHHIKIEVKQPGLTVRTRDGFYGRPEAGDRPPVQRTRHGELLHALRSPFNASAIHVRLTPFFTTWPGSGPIVSGILYIDPADLTFSDGAAGGRKAAIDILAMAFGDNGQPIASSDHTYNSAMDEHEYQETLKNGLFYHFRFPMKTPGAYQVRVAVRDSASGRMGSASQFIEVPDLRKGRLTLSSVAIESSPQISAVRAATSVPGGGDEGRIHEEDAQGNPAVRIFKPGDTIAYGYQVLNAQAGKDNQVDLESQTHLYREGGEINPGKRIELRGAGQPDTKRLLVSGSMKLAPDLAAGHYILQVVVNDKSADEKYRTASQWIDFEVQ